ncbi:MAG TPA: hypothetical protein VEF90_16000, partial [Xanthobacteraceae bacterium]|nr:hypothetical protein [Xanthobacteraceae bacterium]
MTVEMNASGRRFAAPLLPLVVAAVSILAMSEPALAGDGDAVSAQPAPNNVTNRELLKKLDAMEQRIKSLEARLKQKDAPSSEPKESAATGSDAKARSKPNKAVAQGAAVAKGATASIASSDQPANAEQTGKAAAPAGKPGDKAILGLVDSPVPGLAI